jgi:hypothetical protein
MNGIKKWLILGMALLLMTSGLFNAARADHDEHKKEKWYQKIFDLDSDDNDSDHERGKKKKRYQKKYRNDSEHYAKEYLTPLNNQTYFAECGACHFAYQPELLPSGSWDKILAGLEDHFGETIELDPESKRVIAEYLKVNAAEHSRAKRSVKIMSSLGSKIPMRITEIPYIHAKHRKINQDVLQRESIDSLSNCSACHLSAEKGIYDDDYVRFPQ